MLEKSVAVQNIRQPKVNAAHCLYNERHMGLLLIIHGNTGSNKPSALQSLSLQQPVIELDINATVQWDLTQSGQSQWNQLHLSWIRLMLQEQENVQKINAVCHL